MSKEYVNRLSYLGFSTIFSAEGDIPRGLGSYACFGGILNIGKKLQKEHYEIFVIRDPKYAVESNRSNLCLLNDKEVRKHLWLVKRLFPFKYVVEESQYQEFSAYKIILDVDAPKFYHKYLLTWLRYLYEFPYNLILVDALRLKHQYLPKENIANLFILCANSFNYRPVSYSEGHGIARYPSGFLKEYELKAKINEQAIGSQQVNYLYPRLTKIKLEKIADNNGVYLEYWLNPEDFLERKDVYLKNYKTLKQ